MSNDEREGLLERPEGGSGANAGSAEATGQPTAQGSAALTRTGSQPIEAVEPHLVGTDVDMDDDTITVTTRDAVPHEHGETLATPVQPAQEQPVVAETAHPADVEAFRAEPAGTETTHVETVRAEPVRTETVQTEVMETAPVETAPQPQAAATDADTLRVERYAEELQAQKVERQAGEVRVSKDVVEEQRTLEVPVEREEVRVRSVTPSETSVDASEAFQEGTISVPVREQDVELRKEVRVAEEIGIEKREVTERERVSGTVREERVNVEEIGDVEVDRHSDSPLNEDVRARD
jgi:uncharacterized protein (TIGR02271 family)